MRVLPPPPPPAGAAALPDGPEGPAPPPSSASLSLCDAELPPSRCGRRTRRRVSTRRRKTRGPFRRGDHTAVAAPSRPRLLEVLGRHVREIEPDGRWDVLQTLPARAARRSSEGARQPSGAAAAAASGARAADPADRDGRWRVWAAHVKGSAKQWRWRWLTLLNGGTWYPNCVSLPGAADVSAGRRARAHATPPGPSRRRGEAGAPGAADATSCLPTSSIRAAAEARRQNSELSGLGASRGGSPGGHRGGAAPSAASAGPGCSCRTEAM